MLGLFFSYRIIIEDPSLVTNNDALQKILPLLSKILEGFFAEDVGKALPPSSNWAPSSTSAELLSTKNLPPVLTYGELDLLN